MEQISALSIPIITIIAFSLVVAEWLLLLVQKKVERNKEAWVSVLSAGLAFTPIFALTKLLLIGIMFWLYQYRLFDFEFQWYTWLLAWAIYDFMFWLLHYWGHKVRIIWCAHNVHHSAKEMKLSVAFRGSFFDFLFVPHNIIWLPLLGFHPFMVLIVDSIGKFYGIIVHVNENWFPNKKRSWIEHFIITPSIHRVHHSVNHVYLDRNFGETFSIWDKIFNTYQPELASETPQYGIMKEVDSEDLFDTQANEFFALWKDIKSTNKLSDKLKYVFMPPGWNHIDGGTTAKKLRKVALEKVADK
jgi:sterol desaturase/sphingolipid hydroxylase (fatty acid hydroxylase superfamily)